MYLYVNIGRKGLLIVQQYEDAEEAFLWRQGVEKALMSGEKGDCLVCVFMYRWAFSYDYK